ncbi:MAG: hypothetical protein KF784_02840 [Fimbriimonadaceae bacterium]|nr:hypothetical protein [Fimbriimonadaceae bacterium]
MSFAALLDRFQGMRAMVVGDLMLDEYIFGKATRISPEAPVMVIRQESTKRLPGGAANVARNLAALGAQVTTIGLVGDDEAATMLEQSLQLSGLGDHTLVRDSARSTTRKTRVVADHSHQVLRIDAENDVIASAEVQDRLRSAFAERLDGVDVIVLSDYLKGTLAEPVVRFCIDEAVKRGVAVVANPKPRSAASFRGANLLSLNRAEATEASGEHRAIDVEAAEAVGRDLRDRYGVGAILVTLGEAGMTAVGSSTIRVSAPRVEVYDTAGAGDTVIATVALGFAAVGFEASVFELAAQTSACVVRHVGVATPSALDLQSLR